MSKDLKVKFERVPIMRGACLTLYRRYTDIELPPSGSEGNPIVLSTVDGLARAEGKRTLRPASTPVNLQRTHHQLPMTATPGMASSWSMTTIHQDLLRFDHDQYKAYISSLEPKLRAQLHLLCPDIIRLTRCRDIVTDHDIEQRTTVRYMSSKGIIESEWRTIVRYKVLKDNDAMKGGLPSKVSQEQAGYVEIVDDIQTFFGRRT